MPFCGYESFSVVQVDATVPMLHHFRVNCFVSKIDQKRFVMRSPHELNSIFIENIRDVTVRFHILAVFVYLWIDVRPLSLETYPAIKSGSRGIVIPHVPLADESRCVS